MASVQAPTHTQRSERNAVVIRFAGDSGDGMQLVGTQFTQATALMGNDLATFPNYPAEIRAPAGTTYGVSTFQIQFGSDDVLTPGDEPEVLVAMNPAALKVCLPELHPGGLLVINTDAFTDANIKKVGYDANPLESGAIDGFARLEVDITKQTLASVRPFGLNAKDAQRCKNVWTLGVLYWLFDRDRASTTEWLNERFAKEPNLAQANVAALNAGHAYAETLELPTGVHSYHVARAHLEPGTYRTINGNEAAAWGLALGAHLAGLPLFYGSYPITPASTILHTLAKLKNFGVTTFQAEDEIAAVCSAIGASYGGALGATGTSGPGLALKSEALGLAVSAELPLVLVNVQRGGPSTGLPTKTEQSDLLQAIYGRNGDCPLAVLAAATPAECFDLCVEAVRLATTFMTPVIVLTDGFLANSAEPWRIPDLSKLARIPVQFRTDPGGFHPYLRAPDTLARPWAVPGTPGLEHRIGGIEKDYDSGNISYDAENHHKMTWARAEKIARIIDHVPPQKIEVGDVTGDVLVVGWGSTYGAIRQAVRDLRAEGNAVSHVHVRQMNPLPRGLGEILRGFRRVIVPELNTGMLLKVLRSEYLVPATGLHRIAGQPFKVVEVQNAVREVLSPKGGRLS